VELDPPYGDVIVSRYEQLSGKKAERIARGSLVTQRCSSLRRNQADEDGCRRPTLVLLCLHECLGCLCRLLGLDQL
jgi:hypothetical protein